MSSFKQNQAVARHFIVLWEVITLIFPSPHRKKRENKTWDFELPVFKNLWVLRLVFMEVSPVRLPKALTRVTVTYEGLKRRSQRDKLHTFRQHSNSNTTTTTVCRHINVDTYLHFKTYVQYTLFFEHGYSNSPEHVWCYFLKLCNKSEDQEQINWIVVQCEIGWNLVCLKNHWLNWKIDVLTRGDALGAPFFEVSPEKRAEVALRRWAMENEQLGAASFFQRN